MSYNTFRYLKFCGLKNVLNMSLKHVKKMSVHTNFRNLNLIYFKKHLKTFIYIRITGGLQSTNTNTHTRAGTFSFTRLKDPPALGGVHPRARASRRNFGPDDVYIGIACMIMRNELFLGLYSVRNIKLSHNYRTVFGSSVV